MSNASSPRALPARVVALSLSLAFSSAAFAQEAPPPANAPAVTAQANADAQAASASAEAQPTDLAAQPSATAAQTTAPAPVYAQPHVHYDQPAQRPSRGMLITGLSIFGGAYLVSAIVGAYGVDHKDDRTCSDCADVGPLMFIPVLGPFLAMGPADGGELAFALLGTTQLVGAGLTIGGAIKVKRGKQRMREQGALTVRLSKGRSLAFDVASSPRFSGSTMRLTF